MLDESTFFAEIIQRLDACKLLLQPTFNEICAVPSNKHPDSVVLNYKSLIIGTSLHHKQTAMNILLNTKEPAVVSESQTDTGIDKSKYYT